MAQIFAYITHKNGVADDIALELVGAAKKIDSAATVTAVVTGSGANLDKVCAAMAGSFTEVWKVDNPALAYPNAEAVRKALVNILPQGGIVLLSHDTFNMDLGPGLSIKMNAAFVADVVEIAGVDGAALKLVRHEFYGQVSTHVCCDVSAGVVLNIRPGVCKADEAGTGGGKIVDKSAEVGDLTVGRRFLKMVEADIGDVDITKSDVLLSVGRGIEDEDNIGIARELAAAMGADICCSRPIVDAKWMEKSRQVGTSGLTVKPKVYLALGISGTFQHMGGVKGAAFMVAVNKNPNAPIFQVADVGIVADILEFMPKLTEKIKSLKPSCLKHQ